MQSDAGSGTSQQSELLKSGTQSDLLRTFLLLLELLPFLIPTGKGNAKAQGQMLQKLPRRPPNHADFLCQLTNLFLISFTYVGGLPWALGIRRFLGSLNLSPL